MSKLAVRGLILGTVIALLGVSSFAIAGGGTRNFNADPMIGYEENPDISTVGDRAFSARLSSGGTRSSTSSAIPGSRATSCSRTSTSDKRAINGGISYFLCSNLGNGPAAYLRPGLARVDDRGVS